MAMNVARGWPFEGAIQENYAPTTGEGIVAGMAVKLDPVTNKLVKADGTQKEVAFFALDDQAASDVRGADKLPVLVGNCTVQTDQYVAGVYAANTEVQISTVAGQEGQIIPHAGGTAPTYGWVTGNVTVTYDGTTMLEIFKPIPFGTSA